MNYRMSFRKHRYLIAASGAILVATLALVLMQYRSARRTEAQARATLEAHLDMHMLALVDEAKREMVGHADHITHSVRQRLVRDRNLEGLARAFTRASQRFPEVGDLFVIFFEQGREQETWRALRYVPPDANDPRTPTHRGVPLGRLVEEAETTEAMRRAWFSITLRPRITTYTVHAPTGADARPRQIFFHPVYESVMGRQDVLELVGAVAFTADPETYPSPDYLRNLIAHYEELDERTSSLLGKLAYKITLRDGAATRELVSTGEAAEAMRLRGFDAADRLFPGLTFGVAPRDMAATAYADEYAQWSILLGLCAAALVLVGLSLTWRATRREMRVAQLKSDFLASISHELKTPLTAIRAFGDLLHSGRARDAGRVREYGGMIKVESDRLTALVNNILEMSRLERGVRRHRLEEGSLSAAIADTVEVFRHTVEARGWTIEVELPASPVKARFDEGALRQAMLNLLSNAVKYSGDATGVRRVEVSVRREGAEAVIAVRDFGVGIPTAEQRHIFTAFHRAPPAGARVKHGMGLGLAIVREIMRAHGGDVSVESEPGAGATFCLRLPLSETFREQTARAASAEVLDDEHSGNRGRAERRHRVARHT